MKHSKNISVLMAAVLFLTAFIMTACKSNENQNLPAVSTESPDSQEKEGDTISLTEDMISATQKGEQAAIDLTFAQAPAVQITFTLPKGISLGSVEEKLPNQEGDDLLLVTDEGKTVGGLFFMDLAAGQEDLKNVIPSENRLPMQIYAGVALSNHVQYENYQVQKYGETSAAATALFSSQDLSLLGKEYSAAVEIPFANEKNVVLFYDYEKLPVFMQITFDKEMVSERVCAEIAKSITVK